MTISAGANPGRDSRSTTVTVTAANGTKPSASIAVSQAGVGVSTNDGYHQTGPLPGEEGLSTLTGTLTARH
ncbi:hypothetical protein NXW84_05655 [Bacteroides fragilis]|nr:hypothetical protein NXW84_05655 [Bacteroides fragilis]